MALTIPASITGTAQSGFTTPGYTMTVDNPPDLNAKQSAVSTITGTQVGVDSHSVARPFTISVFRPKSFNVLGKPNPTTGLIASVPRNTYKIVTRKGVIPLAGQPSVVAIMRTEVEVPAGADIADPANIRAMVSCHLGGLTSMSSGIGDTSVNGLI